jgi:hypothetical protein
MGATPTLAAGTPFSATFNETTTPRACPAGAPPNAFCFTGTGSGPVVPPGDPNASETFAGFVDPNTPNPVTGCPTDRNAVRMATNRGTLFVTTLGSSCGDGVDNGTWTAHGGTGIFEGASGTGTVHSTASFTPNGTISSVSSYSGVLTLRH